MFYKLTQLALCFAYALTAMCNNVEEVRNGQYKCGKIPKYDNDISECSDPMYNSKKRFQLFGIDCCNKVAYDSMKDFQDISNDVSTGVKSLFEDSAAVS